MNELSYQEILDLVAQVEVYLDYQCDSRQEALQTICHLCSYPDYINDDLYDLCIKELQEALKDFQTNWEIVETTKTIKITEVDLIEKYRLEYK